MSISRGLWDQGYPGAGVTTAFIGGGFQWDHPDRRDNYSTFESFGSEPAQTAGCTDLSLIITARSGSSLRVSDPYSFLPPEGTAIIATNVCPNPKSAAARRSMFRFANFARSAWTRYWSSFSYVGLAVATLFFAASLTPSLLPRHYAVQGLLSGLALAVGYGVGVFIVWLWLYLEVPRFGDRTQWISKGVTTAIVAAVVALFLWRSTIWQNSIRELMGMEPVASAYPWRVAAIAFVAGALLIAAARLLGAGWRLLHRQIVRVVPRRVSYVVSTLLVAIGLLMVANKVLATFALNAADAMFLRIDTVVDENMPQPTDPAASGSEESLIPWDTIGRQGKNFIVNGPTQESIAKFRGGEAQSPLRVYVGLASKDTPEERAQLALQELIRVGGFKRSFLIVATPTGTGWLDPGAVDTVEYLHGGDTAIVSMQYSYLPSWITILVDPQRSQESARVLFDEIYGHWRSLPRETRPKLYVHGLSLGSLGSEASADLFTVFEDPIQGGVWSGPPFPSSVWSRLTRYRNAGTPMWLPEFRDSSMLRFTAQKSTLDQTDNRWGPMRFVYLQYASDPMCFFSPEILYKRPAWLVGPRGPDVSPYLRWYPIITFLQIGFDLPMATAIPHGYGHNYAPANYIEAWIAVTAPANWTAEDTARLKKQFAPQSS